jgi:hypothetical protein
MRKFLAGVLFAAAAACGGATTDVLTPARVDAGGGASTYAEASYIANKAISTHGYYGFLDNSQIAYAGGAPVYGHASFDDNASFSGAVNSDHHHSFQSASHYGGPGTLGSMVSFFSQLDVTGGTVNEAYGLQINSPTGAGVVRSMFGLRIAALTRGTDQNWGVYVDGPTPSYFGGPVVLPSYTAATVPAASKYPNAIVILDGRLSLSDGVAWR